jgi:hypothetical protein
MIDEDKQVAAITEKLDKKIQQLQKKLTILETPFHKLASRPKQRPKSNSPNKRKSNLTYIHEVKEIKDKYSEMIKVGK